MPGMQSTDLIPSISIDALLEKRKSVAANLEAARASLASLDESWFAVNEGLPKRASLFGVGDLVLKKGSQHGLALLGDGGVRNALRKWEAAAWQQLLCGSGMRSFMDAEARAKWDADIDRGDVPELTRANIDSTLSALLNARGEFFVNGLVQCFRDLSWCYKSNLPHKLGKRIILQRINSDLHSPDPVDDLLRVLQVLDGKPQGDHRHGTHRQLLAAGLTYPGVAGSITTDYYTLIVRKNGNGHLVFTRPDLVDKANQIIGAQFPRALPPPERRRP